MHEEIGYAQDVSEKRYSLRTSFVILVALTLLAWAVFIGIGYLVFSAVSALFS